MKLIFEGQFFFPLFFQLFEFQLYKVIAYEYVSTNVLPKQQVFKFNLNLSIYSKFKIFKVQGSFKRSRLQTERRAIAEYFCCGNTLLLLVKLEKPIQIPVLISVQLKSIQKWEVCDKSKICVRLIAFWMTLVYTQLQKARCRVQKKRSLCKFFVWRKATYLASHILSFIRMLYHCICKIYKYLCT